MHDNSKTALKNAIRMIIEEITFNSQSGIQFGTNFSNCILTIRKELKAQKGKDFSFLFDLDICTIIYANLFPFIKNIPKDTPSNILKVILDLPSIETLTESIFNFLIQLPRVYSVRFNIPLFDGDKQFQHDDMVVHLSFKPTEETGLFNKLINKDLDKIPDKTNGLNCTIRGYCYNVQNDTFMPAFSLLKVIIQQGLSKQLFVKNKNYINTRFFENLSLSLSQRKGKNIPVLYVDIKDELDGNSLRSELPDHIGCFLDRLQINTDSNLICDKSEVEINLFFQVCRSLSCVNSQNIKSIRSAIEWAFDSYTNEEYDRSMAFLQVCFGLEALFTENGSDIKEEKASILSTLSIKCAYLISNTAAERKIIVDRIKQIYRLRSNLVHGRQNSLTSSEMELFFYGRKILEKSIAKEIELNSHELVGNNEKLST